MAFLKGQHSFQPVVRICNRKMITTRYATFCDYVTSTTYSYSTGSIYHAKCSLDEV